jgi:hypothetical protein
MAAIDKIYGSTEEYDEFRAWLEEHKPELLMCLCQRDGYRNNLSRPISNFPTWADKWLMANCPLKWVKDRIAEQYNLDAVERIQWERRKV